MKYKFVLGILAVLNLGCVFAAAGIADDPVSAIAKPLIECPNRAKLGEWQVTTNIAIRSSYDEFKKFVNSSTYFCSHNEYKPKGTVVTPVHPVIEYMAFLVSLSRDQKIATILDHLIKTAGPFGFSKQVANSAEEVIYHIAMNAVSRTLTGKLQAYRGPIEENAFQAIQAMHPAVKLDLPPSEVRWSILLDVLQHPDFFKAPSGRSPIRYSLLNDVFQLSFLLGATPRYKDGLWLSDVWQNDNNRLERDHDFIQWLFPIRTVGVDPLAPLLNDTIKSSLTKYPNLAGYARCMMRISFARMANFWGQQMVSPIVAPSGFIKKDNVGHNNWLIHTHNNARMDRILRCLSFWRMGDEFKTLFSYLRDTTDEAIRTGTYPSLSASMQGFWRKVIFAAN